jgi:DNA-binding SARP family transcriptional activator
LTAPTLYRDGVMFQVYSALMLMNCESNESLLMRKDYFDKALELGNRLAQLDPWRKKYWLQEVAMITMDFKK